MVSLSCPDTGEQLNLKCRVRGMPRSSKPLGAIRKGRGDLTGEQVCVFVCVCERETEIELRDSVGVHELIFSQRSNQ